MKAVVTGGAGFIGSHVIDRLLDEGYQVTAFDSLTEGKMQNIAHLKGNKGFRFVEGDMRDAPAVDKVVSGQDAVFHLAAHANIRKSLADHKADLEHNLVGMINLLDGMVKHEVNDLVFASSSAVYGQATVFPTPEDYMPVQTSLYGASKMACESWAQAYVQFSPIRIWSYRFANVVGERCRRGVIWDFVHKLRADPKTLEILGDGKQSKEYLYVKDCVEGIMTGYRNTKGPVEAFNLGLEDQTSVDEVAGVVTAEMGLKGVRRRYTGGTGGWIGDNPRVELSMKRIMGLGWKPSLTASDAIRVTTRWTLKNG